MPSGMRILTRYVFSVIAIALLLLAPSPAHAQETIPPDGTTIKSAQVSGIDTDKLSPGLNEDITKLVGTALDRQKLRELAARLEAEQPRYVAAVRVTPDPDGAARVVFVVARMRDPEPQGDINAKYVVEEVVIEGVKDTAITAEMRADQDALKGKPLDEEVAERLTTRLKSAFPDYTIQRRTSRGSQRGQIRVVFHLERSEESRWLRFEPMEANALFHSDQGWGAKLPLTINANDFMVVPHFAIDVGDDLIEEYSGFGLRFESRKLGTERLGVFFEWATYDQTWRDPTLFAVAGNPAIPALYRNRMTVSPLVKFAITPHLTVAGGVSITELDSLNEEFSTSQMANAAIASVRFNQRWKPRSGMQHALEASFTVRSGLEGLESDLVYDRYLTQADYLVRAKHHQVLVSGMFGSITGSAPLFERFSLGDSRTLRGWDKYDIAPAGGDRMFHSSVEYRYRMLALFLDSGSVWDKGTNRQIRFSTGFGFTPGPAFFMVGFPLNTDEFRAVFTMGLRFSTVSVGFNKR
jgi:hypothetical protein